MQNGLEETATVWLLQTQTIAVEKQFEKTNNLKKQIESFISFFLSRFFFIEIF